MKKIIILIVLLISMLSLSVNAQLVTNDFNIRQNLSLFNSYDYVLQAGTTVNITLDTAALIATGDLQSDCGDLRVFFNNQSPVAYSINALDFQGVCNTATTQISWQLLNNVDIVENNTDYSLHYDSVIGALTRNDTNESSYLFFDSFNRPDNTTVGNGWLEGSTNVNYNILSNELEATRVSSGSPSNINHSFTGVNFNSSNNLKTAWFYTLPASGTLEDLFMRSTETNNITGQSYQISLRLNSNQVFNSFTSALLFTSASSTIEIDNFRDSTGDLLYNVFSDGVLQASNQNSAGVNIGEISQVLINPGGGAANPKTWLFDDWRTWLEANDSLVRTLGVQEFVCQEDWQRIPTVCTDNLEEILYQDLNTCGTTNTLPANNGTFVSCSELPASTQQVLNLFVVVFAGFSAIAIFAFGVSKLKTMSFVQRVIVSTVLASVGGIGAFIIATVVNVAVFGG